MKMDDDDRAAFEAATRDVRPIKRDQKIELRQPRPKALARQSRAAAREMLSESLSDTTKAALGEEIAFRRRLISKRTFKLLQEGRFSIEDELDLHGMRRADAKKALSAFVADCVAQRLGCVRVIHGKGTRSGPDGPVLKASVQHWLAHWDSILAFVSANARDGGSGAIYVLLRNH
jgi:DNA-nicking Smr family endonuclease